MTLVVLSLGSNLGDRKCNIERALEGLSERIDDLRCSPHYESAPMYVEDQPEFINAAAAGHTTLSPLALLKFCKQIESRIGRQTRSKNGPREIDVDLIFYGSLQLRSTAWNFELPHPSLAERLFVLQPILDLNIARNPATGADLTSAADRLRNTQKIARADAAVQL